MQIDPELKRDLYTELVREGISLKEWFTRQARVYIEHRRQPSLFGKEVASDHADKRP